MHQNIAGFLSKKDLLEITLSELRNNKKIIDVLCLSETFIQRNNEANIRLKGYSVGSSFCRLNKRRGGYV